MKEMTGTIDTLSFIDIDIDNSGLTYEMKGLL